MTAKYANDYKELHARGFFAGYTVLQFKEQIRSIFQFHSVKSALDYGAGKCLAYKEQSLAQYLGVDVTCYDPFVEEHNILTDELCDAVISIDVIEHIPEGEELDKALDQIFGHASKCVVLTFCNRPAKKTLPSTGENVHITLHNRHWWEEKLKLHNRNHVTVYLFENE